ncbi:MAG: aminodeoxychorismate synthase component I [Planctomycetes bacterium]|nr:aminodeoxychorismate synthase component I [Planctomycetota bacterium]
MIFRPRVFELAGDGAAQGCASLDAVHLDAAHWDAVHLDATHWDAAHWLRALGQRRQPVLLDSATAASTTAASTTGASAIDRQQRYSLLGFDPLEGVGVMPATLAELGPWLEQLQAEPGAQTPGPFHGGFLGALSYDLGVAGEDPGAEAAPCPPSGGPGGAPIIGGLYTDFLIRDHRARRSFLVLGDEPGDGRAGVELRRREVEHLLATAGQRRAVSPRGPLVRHTGPAEHRRRVEQARDLIRRGEIYQANLAHRFTREMEGRPEDLYAVLRAVNPAPYGAFVSWGEGPGGSSSGALLSASPELLLEYDGKLARTRPIKGTAPRGRTPREDARLARELLASRKDLAELTMIVDLERNDLGRVAQTGSVAVTGLPTLQSLASVHHLVADVTARPRAGQGALDLLAALFPGGSITGAPKLRAMEVIAELEGEGRGFFTGSAGFIDTRGHCCFNILIRTLVWRALEEEDAGAGEVSYHVGGGITWASEAAAEDAETLDKGAALAAALEGDGGRAAGGLGHVPRGTAQVCP